MVSKQQATIVISLFVLALILVSGARIWQDQMRLAQQTRPPSIASAWKTLSNDSGHYEIQYPSELTVFNFHRGTDVSLYGSPTTQTNVNVSVLWGDTVHYGTSSEELHISSRQDLNKVVDEYVALWSGNKQEAADGGFVTYKKEHTSFNRYDAIALTGTRTAAANFPNEMKGRSSTLHAFFILHRGRVYKIQYQDQYQDDQLVTDTDEAKLLATFHFTDD